MILLELRNRINRGQYHIFLGHPQSSGVDKTVVEPGNAFSPGLWTLGVSLAVRADGQWISPETRDLPLGFSGGRPPITESRYKAGSALVHSELCHLGGPGWQGMTYLRAHIDGHVEEACILVRDIGPAGAAITSLEWREAERTLVANGCIYLMFETPVVSAEILPVDAEHDSPMAAVRFEGEMKLCVKHGYANRAFSMPVLPARDALPVDKAFERAQADWDAALPARLFAPDARIGQMWEQCAFHMLSAMECGLPRISVANYPVFWMRDCVIVLRALDLFGRSDLARTGCEYLEPLIFSGGFGSESDNPGEGIWALVHHALVTRDVDYLRCAYPSIVRRVAWIERMLHTDEPIFRAGDSRTLLGQYAPSSVLVCMAHEGGHIHGRMDWHAPDFYINCWAFSGLDLAARAAQLLGEATDAADWRNAAEQLDRAIASELMPAYGNDRDSCAAPYPCGALSGERDALREAFLIWYRANRLDTHGQRIPEPLWTYFEAAQIHNAVLLGLLDEAWACLDGLLEDPRWHGMSAFHEGVWNATEMLPYGREPRARGWLQQGATGANMPHNWTTSEVALMLRTLLLTENPDGLTLLGGVPDTWLEPGLQFGVKDMPTDFGTVSFTATALGGKRIRIAFEQGADIPYVLGRSDLEVVP